MKPDHVRTYERMPRIVEAHFCPQLLPRVKGLLDEVHADEEKSAEDWERMSRMGIALLSLSVMIAARTRKITEAYLDEMCQLGIEDMYTPVNVPAAAHPLLPWLTAADLEVVPGPEAPGGMGDEEIVD
jgi:hypothetical protein